MSLTPTALAEWARAHKPRGSRRARLALAFLLWLTVGTCLLVAGVGWCWSARHAVLGLALAARRIVTRIEVSGEDRCLGGFLSVRTWALVALMAGLGRLLRSGILARSLVGLLYVTIGAALLLSSRLLLVAWRRSGA
jgi:hypothetical protein